MAVPNINFGSPIIFFDSHPEEQESYLYSYWSALKGTLHIAWSGIVPKQLFPGTLRIVWWTTEGSQGIKDYELYQHELVKDNYDSLLSIPDVRRCLITGFSGQNPYVMEYGHDNPWIERQAKLEKEKKRNEYWAKKNAGRLDEGSAGKKNAMENIEMVIQSNEEAEKERLLDVDREDV